MIYGRTGRYYIKFGAIQPLFEKVTAIAHTPSGKLKNIPLKINSWFKLVPLRFPFEMVLLTFFERTFATIFGGTVHSIFGRNQGPSYWPSDLLRLPLQHQIPPSWIATSYHMTESAINVGSPSTRSSNGGMILIEFCIKTYSLPETNPIGSMGLIYLPT